MDIGSSYVPSDILAAFLYAQLEAREIIQSKRERIWNRYEEHLRDWAVDYGVQLPSVPSHCEQPFHMFYLLLPSLEARQALITYLNAREINSVFHYSPLHLSSMGMRFGGKSGDCPVTEEVSDRLVRLPFYNDLTEAEQMRVVAGLKEFRWKRRHAVN